MTLLMGGGKSFKKLHAELFKASRVHSGTPEGGEYCSMLRQQKTCGQLPGIHDIKRSSLSISLP